MKGRDYKSSQQMDNSHALMYINKVY